MKRQLPLELCVIESLNESRTHVCFSLLSTLSLSLSLSLSLFLMLFLSAFQMRATRPRSHTCCLAFWMSSLLLWTAPRVVEWHGPPPLVAWLIVYMEPNFMPSLHPHSYSDSSSESFFPSLFTSSSLFIPPLLILLHPLISTNAVASFHPYFPPSLCVYVLCARQPVRVCYCSSSSSPSWLRLVLWCQQPRAVLAWEGLKLPCFSTGCHQPPLSLPTLCPNSPGGTMTLPRYSTLFTEWWVLDFTWTTLQNTLEHKRMLKAWFIFWLKNLFFVIWSEANIGSKGERLTLAFEIR